MDRGLNNRENAKALAARIAKDAGVDLQDCYQCGKCSGGCPMAGDMDLKPRQIIQYMRLGLMGDVLRSKSIWLCAACHTCVDRCPHDINLPGLIEGARMEAKRRGMIGVKEVDKFTDIFLENVKMFGKNQEVVLEGLYNVTTGHLMQDMVNVPHMLKHKIVGPELNTTKQAAEVKELMLRAQAAENERKRGEQ